MFSYILKNIFHHSSSTTGPCQECSNPVVSKSHQSSCGSCSRSSSRSLSGIKTVAVSDLPRVVHCQVSIWKLDVLCSSSIWSHKWNLTECARCSVLNHCSEAKALDTWLGMCKEDSMHQFVWKQEHFDTSPLLWWQAGNTCLYLLLKGSLYLLLSLVVKPM